MIAIITIIGIIFPFIGIPFVIVHYGYSKKYFWCALSFAIIMSVISYAFINLSLLSDLYRYGIHAIRLSNLSWTDSLQFEQNINSNIKNLPLAILFLWIVGHIGDVQLIPAITAFFQYFVVAYIMFDYIKDVKIKISTLFCYSIIILSTVYYYGILNAMRSTIALSFGLLILYLDIAKNVNKLIVYPLYIAPYFMHSVGLFPLALRIVFPVTKKYPKLIFILSLASIAILYIIAPYFSGIPVLSFLEKVTVYIEDESEWSYVASTSTKWVLLKMLNILFMIDSVVLLFGLKQIAESNQRFIKLVHFDAEDVLWCTSIVGFGLMLAVAVMVSVPSYLRFSYIIYPISTIYIIKYYYLLSKDTETRKQLGSPYVIGITILLLLLFVLNVFYFHELRIHVDMHSLYMRFIFGIFSNQF